MVPLILPVDSASEWLAVAGAAGVFCANNSRSVSATFGGADAPLSDWPNPLADRNRTTASQFPILFLKLRRLCCRKIILLKRYRSHVFDTCIRYLMLWGDSRFIV